MAIDRKTAEKMFQEMISQYDGIRIEEIIEDEDEGLFVLFAVKDDGYQLWPGELFPSIRIKDGELVDFSLPTPA